MTVSRGSFTLVQRESLQSSRLFCSGEAAQADNTYFLTHTNSLRATKRDGGGRPRRRRPRPPPPTETEGFQSLFHFILIAAASFFFFLLPSGGSVSPGKKKGSAHSQDKVAGLQLFPARNVLFG